MSAEPAARVGDPFGHSSALSGALIGLAVGAAVGIAIVATGGLGAIAIGAAVGLTGGAGMIGQSIGATIMGPPTGAIAVGSPNVFTNARPQAAAVIATGPCAKESGAPVPEATGAATVLINGMPAGRVSETMACSAKILSGSSNVLIGGASVQVLPITPEVPAWLSATMNAMAIGGTLIATGGIAATYGIGTAVGSLVGGMVFGELGAHGGGWLADQMGMGATGRAIMTAGGGLLGGALGGGAGFRGGRAFDSRYVVEVNPNALGSNGGNIRIRPRESKPDWMKRRDEGRVFNQQQADRYPHNEVMINGPPGSKGYPRVDSYDPAKGEIISRKNTQLAEVQESTANGYLKELADKYPDGSTIADVPTQRAGSGHINDGLGGRTLEGRQILEVPVQTKPVPKSVLDKADELDILIRDINGKTYP